MAVASAEGISLAQATASADAALGVFTAWCTLVVFVNFTYVRRTNQHYTDSYCLSICKVFERWNSVKRGKGTV